MDNVLLKGIVGSTAYGLDHADSDKDYLGVYAAPTKALLGLSVPKDSVVTKDPDTTLHEARKFVQLCLGGNPTVSELLWLSGYETVHPLGRELVAMRRSFLSAERVRSAYLGYAWQQFERLRDRGDGSFSADTRKRTEKHARHMVRLVLQGTKLYRAGDLTIAIDDPAYIWHMGKEIAEKPEVGHDFMQQATAEFNMIQTPLPDEPDRAAAERWLMKVREAFWEAR